MRRRAVLGTCLTKRRAEDLADHSLELEAHCRCVYSEIDTMALQETVRRYLAESPSCMLQAAQVQEFEEAAHAGLLSGPG